jgi:hypothetical protein
MSATTIRRGLGTIAASALVVGMSVALAPAAQAADPHQPFTCSPGGVLLVVPNSDPTQGTTLYHGAFGAGTIDFTELATTTYNWNGTGYNSQDGYMYGADAQGNLLQIGSDGSVTVVGQAPMSSSNAAAFDNSGHLWIKPEATVEDQLVALDVSDMTTATVQLSADVHAADITFANGYLWGLGGSNQLSRIDTVTGQVSRITVTGIPGSIQQPFGGAITFGDGTLGFFSQVGGSFVRVKVTDPASTSPTAQMISSQSAPAASLGDAATCISVIASGIDLQLSKTAPGSVAPSSPIDYTLTVHNTSSVTSSGWTVVDDVPAAVTGLTTDTAGCSISGQTLTCTGGALVSGGDAVIHVTGTASQTGLVSNTASVLGNDRDPNTDNDEDTAETMVAETPGAPMVTWQAGTGIGGLLLLMGGGVLLLRRRTRAGTATG